MADASAPRPPCHAVLTLEREVALLVLDRPGRGNALVPELLHALRARLREAAAAAPRALVVTGAGRAFSAGGDVAAFAEAADNGRLEAFAGETVGALNAAILDLLAFPAPVLARVNGPVTGGAAGLMFAADMVAMSETAFLQPYYGVVGFAPDGGWTALLPERIGAPRALELQALNTRLSAAECRALGLASVVAPPEGLDAAVDGLLAALLSQDAGTLAAARALVWTPERRAAVADALERERRAFLDLVARPQTRARMRAFLEPAAR